MINVVVIGIATRFSFLLVPRVDCTVLFFFRAARRLYVLLEKLGYPCQYFVWRGFAISDTLILGFSCVHMSRANVDCTEIRRSVFEIFTLSYLWFFELFIDHLSAVLRLLRAAVYLN